MKMEALRNAGVEVFYFPNKGRSKRNLKERILNKLSKARVKKMVRSLPVNRYDCVVVNMGAFENTTTAWKDFYTLTDNYIVLYHNYKKHEVFRGGKKRAIQNWINQARYNLFASTKIAEVLEHNSGIKVANADRLLNPISFDIPFQPHSYPPLQNGKYRLIMLAALDVSRKAQDILIDVLSSEKWLSRNWSLHLYGDGQDRQMLQELINKKGAEQKIFLEGHTDNVKSVLEQGHLLLQLTHMDAMPLSVVEAMAVARPVVASKVGDMPEWIRENENGWLSEDASAEEIDQVLERAWQQKTRWPQMGEKSFSIFREKFSGSAEQNLLDKIGAAIEK